MIGILAVIATSLYALLQKEKKEKAEEKAKVAEKASEVKDKAAKAMLEGLENENKKVTRGYFNNDFDK